RCPLSLHDALPIFPMPPAKAGQRSPAAPDNHSGGRCLRGWQPFHVTGGLAVDAGGKNKLRSISPGKTFHHGNSFRLPVPRLISSIRADGVSSASWITHSRILYTTEGMYFPPMMLHNWLSSVKSVEYNSKTSLESFVGPSSGVS